LLSRASVYVMEDKVFRFIRTPIRQPSSGILNSSLQPMSAIEVLSLPDFAERMCSQPEAGPDVGPAVGASAGAGAGAGTNWATAVAAVLTELARAPSMVATFWVLSVSFWSLTALVLSFSFFIRVVVLRIAPHQPFHRL
jgi:hypothetical protein